jgi:lipopolysaccharide assembly outer membrane protein LptD (OstA)
MKPFATLALLFLTGYVALAAAATTEAPSWEVQALSQILPGNIEGKLDYDPATGRAFGTNGIFVKYGDTVLTADSASLDSKSGDVEADGHVRVESGEQLWLGEHIHYNFKTRQMQTEEFRAGKWPVLAGGTGLAGNSSNRLYTAEAAYVTTDDNADPAFRVRASRVRIVPGRYVQMWNAILYAGDVPIFYFPFYQRNLGPRANNFTFSPGYRGRYGAFLLNTYNWFLGDTADGKLHVDYRSRRGFGAGPDMNLHLGQWGEMGFKYYYLNDQKASSSTNAFPQFGHIPQDRQRFQFTWLATPATNLDLKALINYQTDPLLALDFFENDYAYNPQPYSFIEANKYWRNWSLDALAQPRINDFFNQVERLPDVRLTGFRQQILDTPVYYDSQSSFGYYRQFLSTAAYNTNGLYSQFNGILTNSAARADTYHQISLPWTFFNWLNVTPRVGGRVTYYSQMNDFTGSSENDRYRGELNTGIDTSFKASQLWAGATNSTLDVDGLRHVIEPSISYVYVPNPGANPAQLPQFDADQPSLMILPLALSDYNNIDSVTSQNVVRFGLRNTLQTRRDGELDDLLSCNLMLDWRLDPMLGQNHLNDLYTAIAFKPRSWLIAESQTRYDLENGRLNLSFQQLTFAPNDRWSWGIGYWYLRGGTWGNSAWTQNDFITSTAFLRLSDNWGARMTHNYNVVTGRLQEQFYTLYRDLRSLTAALTFRVTDDVGVQPDYTIAIVLSLKASPATGLGEDAVNRTRLVGE